MISVIASSVLICIYTAFGYLIPLFKNIPFIDYGALSSFFDIAGNMFGDAKMLADYFVFVFPIALGILFCGNAGSKYRFVCFLISAMIIVYSVLDFNIGTAVALAVSFAIILLVRNYRFIYLLVASSCVLVVAWSLFPSFFSNVVSAVIPDSTYDLAEYVAQVWNGTLAMIDDHFLTGIGLGATVWRTCFSRYALGTVSLAPHSHSLYLQIISTLGFFGFVSFIIAVVCVFRSAFSYQRRISAKHGEFKEKTDNQRTEKSIYRSYVSAKLGVAAPVTSLVAALVLGISDNIWYNYRLFFMFWLVSALAVSCSRCTDGWLAPERISDDMSGTTEADLTIYLDR